MVLTAVSLNALGVARALGSHGVTVHAVDASGDPRRPERASRHFAEFWQPRDDSARALVDCLLENARRLGGERPVLLAITDQSVEALAEHRAELEECFRIPAGSPQSVLELLSKKGIDDAAHRHGMPVPATRTVGSREELERALSELRAPWILKPQDKDEEFAASGAKKAYRFEAAAEALSTWDSFDGRLRHVVVQEYVPGGDRDVWFCLTAMSGASEPLATFVGRKIRQWPPLCGGTASCEPVRGPDADTAARLTVDFFQKTRQVGINAVEFKRDPRDGSLFMIEPTVARTDWQSAIADINGVPIPYLVYCDAVGAPQPALRPTRLAWRWVEFSAEQKAVDYYRRAGELSRLGWLWSIRPPMCPAWFRFGDPGPALVMLRDRFGRALRKVRALFGRGRAVPGTHG